MSTSTSRFGVGKRESHDAGEFYARFRAPELSADDAVHGPLELAEPLQCRDARALDLPDACVALVVTSPPYFAGKAYEAALGEDGVPGSYLEYLQMLRDVFAECLRALEPGGRMAVNVANLGRKPFRSLAGDVTRILQDDLGMLLRGEVVWVKAEGAAGNCAWGSFRSPANPSLRDLTERVIIAGKGRFDRARPAARRAGEGLPHQATLTADEFMEATLDVWRIAPESAKRVGHPAPFPVELPQRLIELYTYEGDLVLDPFLGSGSTAVAAARTGRRYAGYDLDPAYVETARARVAAEGAAPVIAARPADGRSAAAVAEELLTASGFTITARDKRLAGLDVTLSFVATDAAGAEWCFDLTGAFTTPKAGLWRSGEVWKALGRTAVLGSLGRRPLVLLTSHLPAPGTPPDKALRSAGPAAFFDAVELLCPDGAARLAAYAQGGVTAPQPGFWR